MEPSGDWVALEDEGISQRNLGSMKGRLPFIASLGFFVHPILFLGCS
tara:strand:+ start:173 stop:313 length:141 start_codon:yes stop_codon:yes gene_type:complete